MFYANRRRYDAFAQALERSMNCVTFVLNVYACEVDVASVKCVFMALCLRVCVNFVRHTTKNHRVLRMAKFDGSNLCVCALDHAYPRPVCS